MWASEDEWRRRRSSLDAETFRNGHEQCHERAPLISLVPNDLTPQSVGTIAAHDCSCYSAAIAARCRQTAKTAVISSIRHCSDGPLAVGRKRDLVQLLPQRPQ